MTKERYNRRGFFGVAGAGLAAAVGWPWLGGATAAQTQAADAGPESPNLIVINAKVYTVDDRMPKAEAFAVRNGRFVAVGNSDEVKSLAGKGTEIFDAQQMTIVPGFIDCHNHAPGNMLLYEVLVGNPYVVEFVTIASIVQKLHARALQTPPDYWVDGYFFDDTKLKDRFVSQKCDGTLSGLLSLCYALAVKTSPPWARPLRSPCRTGRLDLIFRRAGIQEEKHRASAAKAAAEMMLPVTRCS